MIRVKKSKDRLEAKVDDLSAEIDRFKGRQAGHGDRVSALTDLLARRFNLTENERWSLRIASRLHDIGEFVMKRDYKKSSGLNPTEAADLRRHPVVAEQELHRLRVDRMTQLAVRWHHENWDGSGYPDALREDEIPLVCRILRVADAFVSLTERRPGRISKSESEALDDIVKSAGIDFDPMVVAALISLERFVKAPDPEPIPELVIVESESETVSEEIVATEPEVGQ